MEYIANDQGVDELGLIVFVQRVLTIDGYIMTV